MQDLLAIMACAGFALNESSLSERDVEHQQQSTNACPTFRITVNAMSGKSFLLDVPIKKTMSDLKLQIAERLEVRSSDLAIVFQSQLVDDVDSERGVIDIGLGHDSVIEVVRQVSYVETVVFVWCEDLEKNWPHRRFEFSFRIDVPWNMPCAPLIKEEVMGICNGDDIQEITNPHLFLENYDLRWSAVFSLGDEHCLHELPPEFDPYEVYVIDEARCRCGTCDLAWMLEGWICPQEWHAARSGLEL